MYIHHYSQFIGPPQDEPGFYKKEIGRYTKLKFRRASKFVLLSLAGVCHCAHRQVIEKDTAIYLTTENGNLGDTETVLEQIFHRHEFPLPYNFINTMSNTAPFYIAQNLGILGRNLTVSSRQLSFERGLELLSCDLNSGVVQNALIGGVDEVCFSASQFESRYQRPYHEFTMIEGSCWLLVKAESRNALGRISAIESFVSLNRVKDWLKNQHFSRKPVLSFGLLVESRQKEAFQQVVPQGIRFDYISEYGYFDSATACGVSGFLKHYRDSCLIHINRDFRGYYMVLVVEKY